MPVGTRTAKVYHFKDLTDALGAWQWQRTPDDRVCTLNAFCAQNNQRALIANNDYVFEIDGPPPKPAQLDALIASLPDKRDTSLPAILTFLPRNGLVPNSSHYILGPESLRTFSPELSATKPGFENEAEAQAAEYEVKDSAGNNARVRLVLFYYPTPEMARNHAQEFKLLPNIHIKRSGVLIAMVMPGASDVQADTLLSRIEYEARITLNEEPPPSPIKPLYQLLLNIIAISTALAIFGTVGGLAYGGMRLYRRKYGDLEAAESMTTLHLTGD